VPALLIPDLDPQRFFADIWGKSWSRCRGAAERFAEVFTPADLSRHAVAGIAEGNVRQPSHTLRAAFSDPAGVGLTVGVPIEMARPLLDAGMTLAWSELQGTHPRLAALAAAVTSWVKARGAVTVGCFLSPDQQGFPWHFDMTHVFAMQIEGRKRWQLGRLGVAHPPFHLQAHALPEVKSLLDRFGLPIVPPADGDFDEVELASGDVLYLPPGTWHRAKAIGRSCHLSVLVRPVSFARLLRTVVAAVAYRRPSWRQDVQRAGEAPATRAELVVFLDERLAEARRELQAVTGEKLVATMEALAGAPLLRDLLLERGRDVI
jgi:hypothetical protein